ncbi:MAG: hypothetical protein ACFFDF_12895 [Candidatus Odinarchaeota archaeon]
MSRIIRKLPGSTSLSYKYGGNKGRMIPDYFDRFHDGKFYDPSNPKYRVKKHE